MKKTTRLTLSSCLSARGRSLEIPNTQAKAPAPPRWINSLQSKVGQAFSLPNFWAIELLEQGQPVYYTGSHSGTTGT
jgi:hypothetical protein